MNKKIEPWREELHKKVEQRINGKQLDDSLLDEVVGGTAKMHGSYKCTHPSIDEGEFQYNLRFRGVDCYKGIAGTLNSLYFRHCFYCQYLQSR